MAKPRDFIDREAEIELFENMLARNIPERILALLIKPEHGKTYLMNYLLGHCKQQQIPVALVDFDTRQGRVVSYWKFVNQICDQVGWDKFSEVSAYESRHHAILPLVQIQTGRGEAGTHFGTKGHFEEADLRGVSGRDLIEVEVGDITYQEAQSQSAARQERLMYEMGRAIQSDLARICAQNRVVLLLDTYERASVETRTWIDEWLFSHLPDRYPNLIVVIAGRPELHDYVSQPRPWHTLMHLRQQFSTPKEEDIQQYAEIWKLNIVGDELRVFMKVARYEIAHLAKIRDAYRFSK